MSIDLPTHYRKLLGIANTWAGKHLPGWDDDAHRDILKRAGATQVEGRYSAKTMGLPELGKALADYEKRGWPRQPFFADRKAGGKAGGRGRQTAERRDVPPQVAQLLRLWGLLAKAGKVQDGGRAALLAWCGRQLGGETPRSFDALTPDQRTSLIEGLKAWLKRE
jgi:hypothetical protein